MSEIIRKLTLRPKNIFLVDSLGGLVTAFFLFVVLRTFNEYFGMPQKVLICLSVIALVFCFYSMICYFFLNENWQPFLKAISMANLLYCGLTMWLLVYYYQSLTALGITYFLAEIIIIGGLVFIELKVLYK